MVVRGYSIKVKDGVFYKVWTPLTPQRWRTMALAEKALRIYLRKSPHLKKKYFKVSTYKPDRRFC